MSTLNHSEKELRNMSKDTLVDIIMGLQSSDAEKDHLIEFLSEQIRLMNQRSYGRKSEKVSPLQMELDLGFNEAEATMDSDEKEPALEEVAPRKRRPAGKRQEDLKKITEHKTEEIYLSAEELDRRFGKGNWKKLPDQIITKLEHVPASFIAVTYKIGVYAATDNQTIVRASKPTELWTNSIATASLVSSIIVAKYVNAVPLYRQEKAYAENNVNISRTTMANWMIMSMEKYFMPYYDGLHKKLCEYKYIHADETRVEVSKDGRKTGALSYMWVYRSAPHEDGTSIVLYDYQKTRSREHPKNFLKGFNGTITTDGYSAYHALEKEQPDAFTVSGCWVHAKRKYSEIVKANGDKKSKGTLAGEGMKKISKIFHENEKLDQLNPQERLKGRQEKIKPLVDDYFNWIQKKRDYVDPTSMTGKAFTYSINQEKYLRAFLDDPNLPMHNNAAEQAIRPFTIGRKNWVMIDTVKGAEASAVIYSLVETAKANGLKTFEYFQYLLTELPKYIHDFNTEVPEHLYPWSDDFPKNLYK